MKNANFSALKPMLLMLAIIGVILSLCSVSLASDSGTGEEVIVAQFEDENIQRMFTLLNEVVNEPIETKRITSREIQNRLNNIYKKYFNNMPIKNYDKDGISFLYNLALFQNLSDDDKQKLIDRYYNTEAFYNMRMIMETLALANFLTLEDGAYFERDLNFFGSGKFQELIGIMNEELIQATAEFREGNFNGNHSRALMIIIGQAEECLSGRGELVVIREVIVVPLYLLLGDYLQKENESKEYIYDWDVRKLPNSENPSNVEIGVNDFAYLQGLKRSIDNTIIENALGIDGVVETTLGI